LSVRLLLPVLVK